MEGLDGRGAVGWGGEVAGRAVGREKGGGYDGAAEAEEVEGYEEELVEGAGCEEDHLRYVSMLYSSVGRDGLAYLVRIIQIHDS